MAAAAAAAAMAAPVIGFPERFELVRKYVDGGPLAPGAAPSSAPWAPQQPMSDEEVIVLDALKRQAEHGPNRTPKPSYWSGDARERALWEAWSHLGEQSPFEAMVLYTKAVETIAPRWWAWPALGLAGGAAADASAAADPPTPAAPPATEPRAAAKAAAPAPATAAPKPGNAKRGQAETGAALADFSWQLECIMAQHAEDLKRMPPADAGRLAKAALASLGVQKGQAHDPRASNGESAWEGPAGEELVSRPHEHRTTPV